MYRRPREMRKAEGFELLTQEQRKKFYELMYEINETLRDRDKKGNTFFERSYSRVKVKPDKKKEIGHDTSNVEVDIFLENGEVMHFQSSMFF